MIAGAWDRLWAAIALWLAILILLESIRILRVHPLPWWIVHGPVIAWGAVALLPWFIALRSGTWFVPVPLGTVPLSLPATYGFTLLALVGLAIVTIPFALFGRRSPNRERRVAKSKIVPGRAFVAIVLLLGIYIGSRSSLSRVWVLSSTSGKDLYSNTTSTGNAFLGLSLVVLAGMAIGYLARQQPLGWIGTSLYLVFLVLAFGSAHRDLVMILIISYLILRNPVRNIRGSLIQKFIFVLASLAAVWLIGFGGLGQLSVLRSGIPASTPSVYTERTLSSLDVMGAAEYLLESGVRPGQLHGASYLSIPAEFVPHVFLEGRSGPPAIGVVEGVFGIKTGASAPLWIEGVLNYGAAGDLLSMAFLAGLWCFFMRRAISSSSEVGRAVASFGPVWILFAYQALSRILIIATIDVFTCVIIGVFIWNWIQADEPEVSYQSSMPSGKSIGGDRSEFTRPASRI